MGDALGAIFGSATNTSGTTTPDPTAQAMNNLRLQQLQQLFSGGSYSDFGRARPDIYTPSPEIDKLLKETMSGKVPGLMGFDEYKQLGLDQTKNYISQIATPQILSTAALQGLEGGGMVPEAIAKGTAEIGLPFVQGLPGASATLSLAPAQRAQMMLPMLDYGRSLREQDLLRRQGVFTTGLTGLPFTPGGSQTGSQRQPPLFGFFGQG